jgi:protein-S-isoprenylcysteine O-methyltransferase Ste14
MSDRHAKIFLTVTALYFVMRDTGAVMVYNRRQRKEGDAWWEGVYRMIKGSKEK